MQLEEINNILKKYWGYDSFRPNQEQIILDVLSGKDVLALLPTGGGKSLCYQIPAMAKSGMVLVISPLIALMKDQVAHLKDKNISAVAIHSGLSYRDNDRILDNAVFGKYKLLYVSPERLKTEIFIERFKKMNISLIAVDEAHCISQWGYDFRPDYLEIYKVRELNPTTPFLALTATATPEVVKDIQEKLRFKKHNCIKSSFHRPNLSYNVLEVENKLEQLLLFINKIPGSGIVYVRSRRKTQIISEFLNKRGIKSSAYHAGMTMDDRVTCQEKWINNESKIIIATNAFGMGIDKPDVRLVVHFDMPPTPESYFQEAGRAGRDGLMSYAVLLYNPADFIDLYDKWEKSYPTIPTIYNIYDKLAISLKVAYGIQPNIPMTFELESFCQNYNLDKYQVLSAIKTLKTNDYISYSESVMHPSKLKIVVDRYTLDSYLKTHPNHLELAKSLLRNYEGLFSVHTSIAESEIAKRLNIDRIKVKQYLQIMNNDGIIEYDPIKTKPEIYFINQRLRKENLSINKSRYLTRKESAKTRLDIMKKYTLSHRCRTAMLLKYFGDLSMDKCNMCDICLGSKVKILSPHEEMKYRKKIGDMISQKTWGIFDLVNEFPMNKRNAILYLLEKMSTESMLNLDNMQISKIDA